nr:ABC transporter ATP-binding protein [Nitrosomonas nitrosa]
MALLEVKGVSKNYGSGDACVRAIAKVDLTINKGEFVAVAGRSGSGKSTLLNLIAGIDVPSSGEVVVQGTSLRRMSRGELANWRLNNVGIIFQAFNLIPVLNVHENIEYPLLLQGIPRAERGQRVKQLVRAVDLEKQVMKMPDQLSGGQRQRVGIARALVCQPQLVVADEPTANLDSSTARIIIELMMRLNKELTTTFIIATHDQSILQAVNRSVLVKDGELC